MRHRTIIALIILLSTTPGVSQIPTDSSSTKWISISGVTLCQTTLTDIRKLSSDFKVVRVEEMDLPENCYGRDNRFTNGEGYSSDQYPGLIFQKGNQSDYIGKIRVTRDFQSKLPNGSVIDMKTMKLRDVFTIYPEFKDTWNSRACSDYWKFSNDTISFYVKIDKTIQPQFPINEDHYYDKAIEAIDLVLSCHTPANVFKEPGNEPIFVLDSLRVNRGLILSCEPAEITSVTVVKGSPAIKIFGPEGKNGVIYIYTRDYAKSKYWDYFKSKSKAYVKAVPAFDKDNDVVYILDNKVLEKNFEEDLFKVNDSRFHDIKVIGKKTLARDFKIKNKNWGIVIQTTSSKGK